MLEHALVNVAAEAGRAILQIYERPDTWGVDMKSDASPLTQADLRANDIICKALARLTPDIPVLSEEWPWTGGYTATYWAVDPLDGTKEFIKRNGDFTVNIALVVEGVACLGVICAPAWKTVWVGIIQDSEFASGAPWAARATPVPPLRMVGSRSHGSNDYPAWVAPLVAGATMIERGSSLKFCLVAQGDADFYIRMGPTSIWDTAAGHAILVAAGGQVVHAQTRQALSYPDPQQVLNPGFVAFAEVMR